MLTIYGIIIGVLPRSLHGSLRTLQCCVVRDAAINIYFSANEATKRACRLNEKYSEVLASPVCLEDTKLLYVTASTATDGNIAQAVLVFYEGAK